MGEVWNAVRTWWDMAWATNHELPPDIVIPRLIGAFILGLGVAYIGRRARGPAAVQAPGFATTLVLLTVLVAMVTLVIGGSVARAFGLVGALSIVRFRTTVEDTRDTAFVIFSVSVGMAMGAGFLVASVASVPVVGVCAFILRRWLNPPGLFGTLVVRIKAGVALAPLQAAVHQYLPGGRVVCVSAKKGGDSELQYKGSLAAGCDPLTMLTEISKLEGVEGEKWTAG